MTLPRTHGETPAHHTNVRLVLIDDKQQPSYLKRAADLEKALQATASRLGVDAADMPGLRGFCVDAARSAEVHQR